MERNKKRLNPDDIDVYLYIEFLKRVPVDEKITYQPNFNRLSKNLSDIFRIMNLYKYND